MTKYAYEYGKRWNIKTPRNHIGLIVDYYHVGDDIADIVAEIEKRLADKGPEFTPSIRRQCVEYAKLRHAVNLKLYLHVAKGG